MSSWHDESIQMYIKQWFNALSRSLQGIEIYNTTRIELYEFDVVKHYFIVKCVRTMEYHRQACHNNKIFKL